jgi:hypothetical protein
MPAHNPTLDTPRGPTPEAKAYDAADAFLDHLEACRVCTEGPAHCEEGAKLHADYMDKRARAMKALRERRGRLRRRARA